MHFGVQKSTIKSVIKLDQPITQYGRVSCLEGSYDWLPHRQLRTAGMHLLFKWVLLSLHMCNFWASLLQYTQLIDQHAHHPRKTPDFEYQNSFGQLDHILLLELLPAQWLNLEKPTMVIIALVREVKATLRNGIYYYENFGVDEVVNLDTLQCVVRSIWDRDKWAIIDWSDNVDIQMDWS